MNSLIRMNDFPDRTACDISSHQSHRITLQILALRNITHRSAADCMNRITKNESRRCYCACVRYQRLVVLHLGMNSDRLNGDGGSVHGHLYVTAKLRFLSP
jgi:hypothetical protein